MSEPRRYTAAGGVVMAGARVLLLRKRANEEIRLPKGHVDPGETPRQTALREVAEETGFADLAIEGDLGEETVRFVLDGEDVERLDHYYRMRLESYRRIARSAKDARRFEVRWCDAAEALGLLTFAVEREFLRRALTSAS